MRDTNIQNTDLSQCLFLTQFQINAAKGNKGQNKYIVCNDDPKLAAELIKTIILRHMELEENK